MIYWCLYKVTQFPDKYSSLLQIPLGILPYDTASLHTYECNIILIIYVVNYVKNILTICALKYVIKKRNKKISLNKNKLQWTCKKEKKVYFSFRQQVSMKSISSCSFSKSPFFILFLEIHCFTFPDLIACRRLECFRGMLKSF